MKRFPRFIPTAVLASALDKDDPRYLNLLEDYEMNISESIEGESAKSQNGTQTILSGKYDEKQNRKQKKVKITGLKIVFANIRPRKKKRVKIMDWKRFHRLRDIYDFLDDLERDYPSLCTISVIGKSVENRDIKMLKISNSRATNFGVWLDASIHPREWISTAVATYIANNLAKNFKKLPEYITNKDWYIVPVLNPDGYEYTHTCNRMWRKNRSKHDDSYGVDLNRNFSYAWGNNGEEGSSDDPNSVFYRGPKPFSEPETAAVRDTILGSATRFKAYLSFHSYFELIIFPWGFKTEPAPHYLRLLEGAMVMSRAIYDTTGYIYKVGSTKDMTYYACGTSTDWAYAIAQIPYSYMVELRSKKHKFRLPKDQIHETCVETWAAAKSLMYSIRRIEN